MLEKNTIIKVTNRDNGSVGYSIPELGNLHRSFQSGETKEITMQELRQLSWLPGGINLLKNYFILDNEEAIQELIGDVEIEYFYTEEKVKEMLLSGSLDQLKDCLDFAPEGTINLVKKVAIELPLNDMEKREAIFATTGFNINNAINISKLSKEEEPKEEEKQRRIAVTETKTTTTQARRVSTTASGSNYNVVSIGTKK